MSVKFLLKVVPERKQPSQQHSLHLPPCSSFLLDSSTLSRAMDKQERPFDIRGMVCLLLVKVPICSDGNEELKLLLVTLAEPSILAT